MTFAQLIRWIQERALMVAGPHDLLNELVPKMAEVGLPVSRVWHAFAISHPLYEGEEWLYADGEVTSTKLPVGFFRGFANMTPQQLGPSSFMGRGEPWYAAHARDGSSGYEVVDRQFEDGVTSYLSFPIAGVGEETNVEEGHRNLAGGLRAHGLGVASWSMTVPGGLDDDQFEQMRQIHATFSLAARLLLERERNRIILHTYLGQDSGDRVLEGRIHRGDIQTLNAAIAFTDLRNFSGTAEVEGADRVLELLNAAFDAQVVAIEANGGHVLSFLGDGVLAIWPDDEGDGSVCCDRALKAAHAIDAAINQLNPTREAEGAIPIRYGIALHYGQVNYGNMGAKHRLAFTVIGPAVNKAARLEGIGGKLGIRPALSSAFAERVSAECQMHGRYSAKGVGDINVWTVGSESP